MPSDRPTTSAVRQVRTAVHAYAASGANPRDILARANHLITDLDPRLLTSCLYADIDLPHHNAQLATAGHFIIDAFTGRPFAGNPAGADWALRWFTPAAESNVCGHATLPGSLPPSTPSTSRRPPQRGTQVTTETEVTPLG